MHKERNKKEMSSGSARKGDVSLIQQSVEREAARLSELHNLGLLTREDRPWNTGFLNISPLKLSLVMLFFFLCTFLWLLLNPSVPLIGLYLLLGFVLVAFFLIYSFLHPFRHSRNFLYERGIVLIKCDDEEVVGAEAMKWCNIARIWHTTVSSDDGIMHGYRLQDHEGHFLGESVSGSFRKIPRRAIEQRMHPYLFPSILSAYEQGTPVDFGPLTLGQEGIGYRGSHLSWVLFERLDTCEVIGKLAIQQRTSFGGRKPWAVVECDLVPNIALLHHLIGSIVSPTASDNPSVFSTPSPLVAGKQATVTY